MSSLPTVLCWEPPPGPFTALWLAEDLNLYDLNCRNTAGEVEVGAGRWNPALLIFPCTVKAVNSILPPLSGTNAPQTTTKTSVQTAYKSIFPRLPVPCPQRGRSPKRGLPAGRGCGRCSGPALARPGGLGATAHQGWLAPTINILITFPWRKCSLQGCKKRGKRQTGNLVLTVLPNTCSCFEKKRGAGTAANIETHTALSQAQPTLHAAELHVIHTTNQTLNTKALPVFFPTALVRPFCWGEL